jgi:uncharacterized protein
MSKLTIVLTGLLLACAYAAPAAAVIDCSKPKSKIDWMLCSNERAALEEQRMALAFRGAMNRTNDRRALVQEQKEWNDKVRDACNEIDCLLKVYRERSQELDTY